ncbi:MAG: PASTA domain-containing protein, partial [Capsulimonadaceae bacterium]
AQIGFVVAEGRPDFSTSWSAGQIFAQDPAKGRSIKHGKAVIVDVSEGPQFLTVPSLVGLTGDKAERALRNATLQTGTVTQAYSETVATGIVTSQTPDSGKDVSPSTPINYTVSKGPEPPDSPSDVQADPLAPNRVQVSWEPADRAKSYRVVRTLEGSADVVTYVTKATQWLDTAVTSNNTYSYTVTATNAVGDSAPSDPTLAITPAPLDDSGAPPGDMSVTPDTGSVDNAAATDSEPEQERDFRIKFHLPRHPGGNHRVRFEVQDSTGTTLVYDEEHHAGDNIDEPVRGIGKQITIRIYVDDALMKQQTL